MARPAKKFEVGQEVRIQIADPLPEKPDNVTSKKAKIVSAEWGGANYIRLKLTQQWFYRLQIQDGPTIEMSESDLAAKIH